MNNLLDLQLLFGYTMHNQKENNHEETEENQESLSLKDRD